MLHDKLDCDVVAFGFEYVRYIHIFAKWALWRSRT